MPLNGDVLYGAEDDYVYLASIDEILTIPQWLEHVKYMSRSMHMLVPGMPAELVVGPFEIPPLLTRAIQGFTLVGEMADQSSMPKKPRGQGPKDPNVRAWEIVQQATGQMPKALPPGNPDPSKNPAAVTLGRLGGLKGGKARADKLTPERRKAIAKKAAEKRWGRRD